MRILSVVLFSIGLLLGVAFVGAAVWADLEASLFDPPVGVDEPLKTLRCPVIITTQESGTVTATFSNPSTRSVPRTVRAHISYGFATLTREVNTQFVLEPGGTHKLEWTVTSDDAAWRHFILTRVHVLRNSPLPSRTGSCGVLVMDLLGLTGNQIVVSSWIASLTTMLIGVILWAVARRSAKERMPNLTGAMVGLAAIVLVAMLASLVGWWVLGGLLLLFVLILTVSVITWAIAKAT
jgi:hypothetical protein